jgi:hypothetical protein
MSEDDFLTAFPGFQSLSAVEQTQILAYFLTVVRGVESVTGAQVEQARASAHLAPGASASVMSRGSKGSGRSFIKKAKGYALERSVREGLREKIECRPTARQTSATVREHLANVPEGPDHAYLGEAVGCFESGYHRASIVMGWCLGFSVLRGWLFDNHIAALNTHMATWRKPKSVSQLSDFDELSERVVLDTARDSKALSKSDHKVLVALLDQRNTYAHPSGRSISPAAAEAFLQQLVDEILLKFR